MNTVLTNENTFTVSPVGSALEADKKINLAIKISVNVHVEETSWTTAQGRSVDGRSHDLYFASRMSLARPAGHLWSMELGLYPVAALVSGWAVGKITSCVGAEGTRPVALLGCQPYQGASGRKQPCWRPAKSSHRTDQGRFEYQAQRVGRWTRTSPLFEHRCRTGCRCDGGTDFVTASVATNDHRGRQSVRQRRFSGRVAPVGKPPVHSATVQSPSAGQLASRPLPETAQGREFISTAQALPSNRNAL